MTNKQDIFHEIVNEGHSAAWEQDWERAAQAYRKALEVIPDHPGALNSLGLALFQMQKFDESLTFYRQAVRVTPTDPIPYDRIAAILEQQGKVKETVQTANHAAELFLRNYDIDKAVECWLHVRSLDPDNQTACGRLGLVYEKLGQPEKSVEQYLALAGLAQQSGDLARAEQIVGHTLQVMPNHLGAQGARAALLSRHPIPTPAHRASETGFIREKRLNPVTKVTEVISKSDPLSGAREAAVTQLAGLLFEHGGNVEPGMPPQTGIHSNGLESLGEAEQTRIDLHIGQAIESQAKGEDKQAYAALERAVKAGLRHPAAYFLMGVLGSSHDREQAREYLSRAVRNQVFKLPAWLLISQLDLAAGRYQAAAESALRALQAAETLTLPAGQAAAVEKLYESAVGSQAQRTETEQRKLVDVVTDQLMKDGWRENLMAIRMHLIDAEEEAPASVAVDLLDIGDNQAVETFPQIKQLLEQKMYRSAMEEAFYALQFAPSNLPLHALMGEILLKAGDSKGAVSKFRLTAELYALRGETDRAEELFNRIAQIDPMDMDNRKKLSELLITRGHADEAVQQYVNMAEVHYQLADLDSARGALTTALQLANEHATTRTWQVEILTRIADIDIQQFELRQALQSYEAIRSLDPDNLPAISGVVQINLRLQQVKTAVVAVDQYIALMEKTGQLVKAIAFFDNLIEENPSVHELQFHLADLYTRTGRVEKAVALLDAMADRLMTAGDTVGAVKALQAIIKTSPPNAAEYQLALVKIQEL